MDVELSVDERNLILVALWQLKLAHGKQRADADGVSSLEMGLKVAQGIDQIAYKLGGNDSVIYGLGEGPLAGT